MLRKLIDPNSAALRALPREDRDLFIAANNAHLLAFDNVSKLPDWISDPLCRLATGGGFATRQLYSDQDEVLFDAMRPITLNGIEDFVTRPDLADRAIFLMLKNIDEKERQPEASFWAEFERKHARILGALLNGVVHGLYELPKTRLKATPRMADFAVWATACEKAFWKAGTFAQAYKLNRDDAVATVIEADLVASTVQSFMATREGTQWEGTSSDLLGALKMAITEEQAKLKEWPSTPRALSARLRRAAATLRRAGIAITFERQSGGASEGKRARKITIGQTEKGILRPSPPLRPPTSDLLDFPGTQTDGRDANPDSGDAKPDDGVATSNALKNEVVWDEGDAKELGDANFPTQTGRGSMPLMITPEMRRRLRVCGYSEEQIAHLTPQRVRQILAQQGWQSDA